LSAHSLHAGVCLAGTDILQNCIQFVGVSQCPIVTKVVTV